MGEAEATARRAKGIAEGDSVKAVGLAEAEAIKARADALAQNQEGVLGLQLTEKWPEIVEAAAKAVGGIDQLIVLNGAQGVSDIFTQTLGQGIAGLDIARKMLAKRPAQNGVVARPEIETKP